MPLSMMHLLNFAVSVLYPRHCLNKNILNEIQLDVEVIFILYFEFFLVIFIPFFIINNLVMSLHEPLTCENDDGNTIMHNGTNDPTQ